MDNHARTALMVQAALLFAVALVLSIIEDMLPPLPIAVPGVKFGLSNIAVMYALFFLGKKQAYAIAVLKSVFTLATRGMVAGLLSFSGGMLSLFIMTMLLMIFKDRISIVSLSIFGAVFHNIGQFIAVSFIYTAMSLWAYLPVLLGFGVIAGAATSALLGCILPAFKKLGIKYNNKKWRDYL